MRSTHLTDRAHPILCAVAALALAATLSPAAAADLLENGDFELIFPSRPRTTTYYGPEPPPGAAVGHQRIEGWRILRGTVKVLVLGGFVPASGQAALDLAGYTPGAVEQSFQTEPGKWYRFTGFMAHHPENFPAIGQTRATINGEFLADLIHDEPPATAKEMRWRRFSVWFQAREAQTTLRLVDQTGIGQPGGLLLDDLSVSDAPDNLIKLGSFESPRSGTYPSNVFPIQQGQLPEWRLHGGTVDLVGDAVWDAAPGEGRQSLALLGTWGGTDGRGYWNSQPGPGTIQHILLTEPGRLYRFTGWVARNPDRDAGRAFIFLDDEFAFTLAHTREQDGPVAPREMRWRRFLHLFRATGWQTALLISSAVEEGPRAGGLVLDGIGVEPVEPYRSAAALPDPLLPPSELIAFAAPGGRIDLSWRDNSTGETAIEIWRAVEGGEFSLRGRVGPNGGQFLDADVQPGRHYAYRVHAVSGGDRSEASPPALVVTPATPAAPVGLRAVAVPDGRVVLNWVDQSSDETAFAIWRRLRDTIWMPLRVVPPGSTFFFDDTIEIDSPYTYRVAAIRPEGASAWSNEVGAIVLPAVPLAPTELRADSSGGWVKLTWRDNSDNERNFEVWRKTGEKEWARLYGLEADRTFYNDSRAAPGIAYRYRVRATNGSSVSEWSNEVVFTPR